MKVAFATGAAVAALAACGGLESKPLAVSPPPMSAPPTVSVGGPLPGRKVAVSAVARRVGAVEVRALLHAGPRGAITLLIGRDRRDHLCFGTRDLFRCLNDVDASALYTLAAFARGDRWGVVFGLAWGDVEGIEVLNQAGVNARLELRRWSGFPWSAFTSAPAGPNGVLSTQLSIVVDGHHSEPQDLGFARSSCRMRAPSCVRRAVFGVADVVRATEEASRAREIDEARRIALAHPDVRKLLAGRMYLLLPAATWYTCDGRFFGGIPEFELLQPVDVDGSFPFAEFDDASGTAYVETEARVTARNVTRISVKVDLNRGRVVSIDLLRGAATHVDRFEVAAGGRPAGGPDSGSCPEGD